MKKKKARDTKKGVIKRRLTFEDFKHCSEATQHEIDKPARKKKLIWIVLQKIIKNL